MMMTKVLITDVQHACLDAVAAAFAAVPAEEGMAEIDWVVAEERGNKPSPVLAGVGAERKRGG